jgi:hypothetical protein
VHVAIPTDPVRIFYIRPTVKVKVAYTRAMEPAALGSNVPLNLKARAAILTVPVLTINTRHNVKLTGARIWAI